jgi:DNA-binding transcriptional LysR family regulator
LQRRNRPTVLADLAAHDCIGLHAVPRWPVMVGDTLHRVKINAKVLTSSVDAARSAAVQGLGLVMLTYWDVYQQLTSGELVHIVLQDVSMEDLSVWAVMPTRRYIPTRVKVFLNELEEALSRSVAIPPG